MLTRDIGIVTQTPNQRPRICIYENLASLSKVDSSLNFGAATEKSYSLAGWCQTNQWSGTAPNRYTEFFLGFGTSTWRSMFRFYETASATKSQYHLNIATSTYFTVGSNSFAIDTWYFVAMAFNDTANTIKMYVYDANGVAMSFDTTTTAVPYNESGGRWSLASPGIYQSSYKQRFNSTGIWNRAISTSEMAELWNNGNGLSYDNLNSGLKTNLMAWWNCDNLDGSGITQDNHTNNLDLTATDSSKVSLVAI